MTDLLKQIGRAFVPETIFKYKVRANLRDYLMLAGYPDVPYKFFGILFFLTAALTYFPFLFIINPAVQGLNPVGQLLTLIFSWALMQIVFLFIICFIIYFFLNIKIYKRTKNIESKLADFLILVSTNLKGGLSLEQALWAAIRPEFGLLAQEMTLVSKRVMTGNDLAEALNEFIEKYDSPILRRNFSLIIGEVESGGKIVIVIDKVIEALKKTKALKDEMSSAAVSYMIFIGVIVIVVAPGLFALAYRLLFIMVGFTQSIGSSLSGTVDSAINLNISVDSGLFKSFSIWALTTISVFSSMIISIIEKGSIKGGLKYIPAFTLISITLYLIFMAVLQTLFGAMM